ncbi:MAG: hypothetical protein LBL80_03420 [Ruminococcus sp.]|jgi:hypothetical protein|nr:hypothetical protein [Ruminococcus sp.]
MKNMKQRVLVAVLSAVMLSSCGANVNETSADIDDEISETRKPKTSAVTEETTREETTAPETSETEEVTTTEPEPEKQDGPTATDDYVLDEYETINFTPPHLTVFEENGISYFPDTAVSYNDSDKDIRYIIDGLTGETILAIPYRTGQWNNAYWVGFENNLVRLRIDSDHFYVDAKGKNVPIDGGSGTTDPGLTVFEDGYYKGVKDKGGNIIIDALYDNLVPNEDNTFFVFSLNGKTGVINRNGEMIIKGLDTSYRDYIFYPESVLAGDSLFSLPDGALIGEYADIKPMGGGVYMVYNTGDGVSAQIIDSKGKLISDIIANSPVLPENCRYIGFNDFSGEKMWYHVAIDSNEGSYMAFLSPGGKNLFGWRNIEESSGNFYYLDTIMVYNNTKNNTTTVYDYTGKKLQTFEGIYSAITDKVFATETDGNYKLVNIDNTEIGVFSNYYTLNGMDTVIVKDADGMFYGLIAGDSLKYPCEYTDIDYVDDNLYIRLRKGNNETRVTAYGGAEITFTP